MTWSGTRKSAPVKRAPRGRPVRRVQPIASRVKWIHESLLGRARCHVALGDVSAAAEDATAATELCCRAPTGWIALAEVMEASAEADGKEVAERARAEVAYLRAMP